MFDTREPVRKNEVQTSRADRLDGEYLKYEYFIIQYFICLRERDHTRMYGGETRDAQINEFLGSLNNPRHTEVVARAELCGPEERTWTGCAAHPSFAWCRWM